MILKLGVVTGWLEIKQRGHFSVARSSFRAAHRLWTCGILAWLKELGSEAWLPVSFLCVGVAALKLSTLQGPRINSVITFSGAGR